MAEKMMKIAGKDSAGLAKGLRTDANGHLRVHVTGGIYKSDSLASSAPLAASSNRPYEIKKQSIIQSAYLEFPEDNVGGLVYQLSVYDLATDAWKLLPLPLGIGSNTPFITPTSAMYDSIWETIVNDTSRRIVRLRQPLEVAGFKFEVLNRSTTTQKNCNYSLVYSRRGE